MYNIDFYLLDKINIISIAFDKDGVRSESAPVLHNARIEDTNILVKDKNGKEVVANAFILVESSANIEYETLIQMVNRIGSTIQDPTKKYTIKKLARAHGFNDSHWEVYL